MRLWEKLGRGVYYINKPFLRFLLPRQARTRCLIMRSDHVLLVKNWLGTQQWTLPGGGVRFKEPPAKSVKREVKEELGIELANVTQLGLFKCKEDGLDFRYLLYGTEVEQTDFKPRKGEIIKAAWFQISSLPKQKSSVVAEALNRYKEL